jgi:hypothetical protein
VTVAWESRMVRMKHLTNWLITISLIYLNNQAMAVKEKFNDLSD